VRLKRLRRFRFLGTEFSAVQIVFCIGKLTSSPISFRSGMVSGLQRVRLIEVLLHIQDTRHHQKEVMRGTSREIIDIFRVSTDQLQSHKYSPLDDEL